VTDIRHGQRVRRLQVLAALAGLLTLLAVFLNIGGHETPQSTGRMGKPVLPDFVEARADAAKIRITLADESYSLINGPDGWTLEGSGGYPVRADRLASLAGGLGELTWGEGRTRDPGKMNRIGLGDPREGGTGALIEIINEAGTVTASLITGRKGPNVYARLPGEDQAFRVNGDLPPLYNHDAWLDLDIIDIHSDAVSAVRLFDARGNSLYLQRSVGSSDRSFRPAPPYQDYRLVSRIAASTPALALTRLHPVGVKPASKLTTRPVARHITETHDGLEVDLKAYKEPDGYYVTLRAIEAGEGAQRGSTINQKASGWAFELTEFDWNEFTPAISSIVRPPQQSDPASPAQP
tara:strand:- start:2615 stop:3664 length:1050 start_codon:yes stop_codon:yes gene_type:complete